KKLEAAMAKYDGQVAESGKADNEIRAEVKALSEQFKKEMDELAQKMEKAGDDEPQVKSAGELFVASDEYKAFQNRLRESVKLEVKNTISSDSNSVFPLQRPGIIPGNFAPTMLRDAI